MNSSPIHFEAIGTKWSIDIYPSVKTQRKKELFRSIVQIIEDFDRTYSRFRSDSLVGRMKQQRGKYVLPSDAQQLIGLYESLYKITGGLFTPLIGDALSDAGYDMTYSLKPKNIRPVATWEEMLDYSFPNLTIQKEVNLDFGAAGKGYLVDIIGAVIASQGFGDYCVDAGGDILVKTANHSVFLSVGLEDPEDTTKAIGVVKLTNRSICGSSGNRRTWGEYHHILNPKTLKSPRHLLATWVIADSTMLADALATCLFFVSPEVLLPHYNFDYVILNADRTVNKSESDFIEMFY